MFYVYILKLSNNKYYVGQTIDLEKRIKEHNSGKNISTKLYRPCKLVWYCAFGNKEKAISFESYLKKGSGNAFRNKHLI